VHLACSSASTTLQREKVVPQARGRVFGIGMGSGLNLPFYDPDKVSTVWGLDPCFEMARLAEREIRWRPASFNCWGSAVPR